MAAADWIFGVAVACVVFPSLARMRVLDVGIIGAIIWLAATARLNWEDKSRGNYCRCFTTDRTLGERLAFFRRAGDYIIRDPGFVSVSTCAAAMGATIGWLFRRQYIRVPLDEFYFELIDSNQHANGCILAQFQMPAVNGQKICPSLLTKDPSTIGT